MQFPVEIACHEDIITQLRIKIAVLMNELKHVRKEKDDAVNASILIARTLGSSLPSATLPSSRLNLENEVNSLRKENSVLRHELQQMAPKDHDKATWITDIAKKNVKGKEMEDRLWASTSIPHEISNPANLQSQRLSPHGCQGQQNGSGRSAPVHQQSNFQHILSQANPISDSKDFAPAAYFSNSMNKTGPTSSFATSSPTIPNTPFIAHLNPLQIQDIGLQSLDDVLGPSPPGSPTLPNADIKRTGQFDSNSQDFDAQLREHECSMASFNKVPKPNVLKTGFEVSKSRRGDTYQWDPNAPLKREERRRMGGARFDTPRGPKASASGESCRSPSESLEAQKEGKFMEELWDSVGDYDNAVRTHQRDCGRDSARFPELFRHGHYFVPSESDSDCMRTVHVGSLPRNISLRDVLARVRGGEIVSAVLADTVKLSGGMTVLVQFVHESAAEEYVAYAKASPIIFGDDESAVEVTLLSTPTWPLSIPARKRIHEHGQTRCLAIHHAPTNLRLGKLEKDLGGGNGHRAESLVDVNIDEDGDLRLEFSSISAAWSAYGILTNWRVYVGLEVAFVKDPCAGPLEELALPVPPRRPMLARNRMSFESEESTSSSDDEHDRGGLGGPEIVAPQRKRLAALANQRVEIPSFSGAGLTSSSWADEVNEEAESSDPSPPAAGSISSQQIAAPPNTPDSMHCEDVAKEKVKGIIVENANELMHERASQWFRDEGFRKPPVGVAGSKYASLFPSFLDLKPGIKGTRGSSYSVRAEGTSRIIAEAEDDWLCDANMEGVNGVNQQRSRTSPELCLNDLLALSSESRLSSSSSPPRSASTEETTNAQDPCYATSVGCQVRDKYSHVPDEEPAKYSDEEHMTLRSLSPTSKAISEHMIRASRKREGNAGERVACVGKGKGKESEIPDLDLNISEMNRVREEGEGEGKWNRKAAIVNPDEIALGLDEDDELPPTRPSSPTPALALGGNLVDKIMENFLKEAVCGEKHMVEKVEVGCVAGLVDSCGEERKVCDI